MPLIKTGAPALPRPPLSEVELTLLRTATQCRSGVVLTVARTPGEEAATDLAARHLLARVGAPTWTGADGYVEWVITPRGHTALEEHRASEVGS